MIYGWMKSIVIYLILSGIVVNLAPANNYKKYIHFFTGLLLLIIIARPVSFLFNIGSLDLDRIMSDIDYNLNYEQDKTGQEKNNYFDLTIGQSIENMLTEEGFCPSRVEVITTKDYKILKCVVNYEVGMGENAGFTDERLAELKNKISDVYNIEVDNIYIVSR